MSDPVTLVIQPGVAPVSLAFGSAGPSAQIAYLVVSDTAPENPRPGVGWWNSTNGIAYFWYVPEGGEGVWVSFTPSHVVGIGDLTTDGLTPGEVLVVDNPSGVTTLALGTAALADTETGDGTTTGNTGKVALYGGYGELWPVYLTLGSTYGNPGYIDFHDGTGQIAAFGTNSLTGYRMIALPDADGTVALTDQIDGKTNLANFVTGVLPEANGGVPAGGTTGQALVKTSATDNDVEWADSASDVGDLTTDGLTPGEVLVVDNPSGVTTLALGTAALVNTGTGATNAILGNDSRLTDPRTPNDHTHGYTDLLPESEEFAVSSSVYFDGSNNLTLTIQDSHRLRIGTDDMVGYSGVLKLGSAPTAGTVVIVWNARTDTTTVKNSDDETLGTIATGNCGLLTSNGSIWTFASFGQRAPLTLAEISPLPIANGGTGAATAALARVELGVGSPTGESLVTATDAATAKAAISLAGIENTISETTYYYTKVAVTNSGTNANLVLTPKGTGGLVIGSAPDGSSRNGIGTYSVDLQGYRVSKTQTASGHYSFSAGASNAASGSSSACLNDSNTASGSKSLAHGFYSVADRAGMVAHANGRFGTTNGSAQDVLFVAYATTTDATPTELLLVGVSALTIPTGKVFSFVANITGVKSDGSAVAMYVRKGCIKNVGGTTALAGSIEALGTDIEDSAGTNVAITADTDADSLVIKATGITSETWRWVASVRGVEVSYGT